jgi:hypothetical protein
MLISGLYYPDEYARSRRSGPCYHATVATRAFDDRELVDLVLRTAEADSPDTTAAEAIQRLVAELPDGADGPANDVLLDFVVGARALRERLAELEVEAGAQAREAGITVRQMSAATGIADRNVRLRYRRNSGDPGTDTKNH